LARFRLPIGKIVLGTAVLMAAIAGTTLASIAPLQSFDWGGLLKGRSPQDILIEGFGQKLDRPYQILVMGVDRVLTAKPGTPEIFDGRTDSMLLVRLDKNDRRINILSIPRDTQVKIPDYGRVKINAANVYGGKDLAISTVKSTLNGVTIDRYVRIDTSGLDEIIDAIGGVEINVPKAMKYTDNTQKLFIDLKPGLQTLNGKQAEGFVRFRNDAESDLGRIKRQQILLQAVKAKLTSPWLLFKLPQLMPVIQKNIDTNLTNDEMLAIAGFGVSVNPKNINSASLTGYPSYPGQFKSLYWLIEDSDVDKAINGKFATDNKPMP